MNRKEALEEAIGTLRRSLDDPDLDPSTIELLQEHGKWRVKYLVLYGKNPYYVNYKYGS